MTSRGLLLFGHIFGFVLWVGVTFTISLMTARAKRTGDRSIMAFAYRTSQGLLKGPGLVGAVLTIVAGFGLTGVADYGFFEPFPIHWMFQMQLLGTIAFLAMVFLQLPNAERLARAAEASAAAGEDSEAFGKFHKRHALLTMGIGLLLVVVMVLGSLKPL